MHLKLTVLVSLHSSSLKSASVEDELLHDEVHLTLLGRLGSLERTSEWHAGMQLRY